MKLLTILCLFILIKSNSFADEKLKVLALEHFQPIPESLIDQSKYKDLIHLGQKLFFETRLSINNKISCNTCHNLKKHGVDNQSTSVGHAGEKGGRNSPTVYNASLHIAQFWDVRAQDLEAQALGPILNPVEMGMPNAQAVVDKISNITEYKELFKKAEIELNYVNIGKAIGAFEKTLLTPSRFDDFLKGDLKVLSELEKKGLKRFIDIGCITCHNGPGVGGGMYMKLGVVNEYKTKDLGRYNVTKEEDDKYVFKVPSLRNIVHTGPYFHDGSIDSLDKVIPIMAHHQLGEKVSADDIKEIKAFLGSLSAKKLPSSISYLP